MKHVYEGKTKSVFVLDDGNFLLKFKDDATGENGEFDPGANTIGLSIEGMGKADLQLSAYFFKKLQSIGIPTHYINHDIESSTMTVRPAQVLGKGLEVICRFRAVGSFFRRYGSYVEEGCQLNSFVEITIKDDERNDPPISKDALAMLGIMNNEEYETLKNLTTQISNFIKDELMKKDMELYDIKLEFGYVDGNIVLIDELSGGNMRVYKDGKIVKPLDLVKLMLND